jgi:biopolymer transport protein ExbD
MWRARYMRGPFLVIALAVVPSMAPAQDVKATTDPKPLDRREDYVLFLNLNARGELVVPGKEPLKGPKAMEEYIRREAAALKRKGAGERARVVLRADEETRVKDVVRVMQLCQKAGLKNISLRAHAAKEKK